MIRKKKRLLVGFAVVWALCVALYIYKGGDDEVRVALQLLLLLNVANM